MRSVLMVERGGSMASRQLFIRYRDGSVEGGVLIEIEEIAGRGVATCQ
jgi:hypothetical protein